MVARMIWSGSKRKDRVFLAVNCAAIPEELIESELFGHEKGSFTGATGKKTGKFQQAHSGTLFLDEIGDMSMRTQAKVFHLPTETTGAAVGHRRLLVALVTDKHILGVVMGQGYLTATTAQHEATMPALDECGATPAVEEQNHLFPAVYGLCHRLRQSATEDAAVAGFQLVSHVHDVNSRQWRAFHWNNTFRKLEKLEIAFPGAKISGHIGSGTAQNDHRPCQFAQLYSHIAGVVAGCLVLLVIPFMLLVEYDKSQVGLGGKESTPGASDDVEFAVPYPSPFVILLAR